MVYPLIVYPTTLPGEITIHRRLIRFVNKEVKRDMEGSDTNLI
jgi:hypothetical protein